MLSPNETLWNTLNLFSFNIHEMLVSRVVSEKKQFERNKNACLYFLMLNIDVQN